LVEHTTENRSVDSSILSLATINKTNSLPDFGKVLGFSEGPRNKNSNIMQRLRNAALTALFVPSVMCIVSRDTNAQQAWQISTTPHFDCYYEPQSQDRISRVLFEAERAYARISLDLRHDLSQKVPVIVVSGDVPRSREAAFELVSRSGAPLRDHLVLSTETDDQIEATLMHELTHQFELELVPNLLRVPQWMLEGLAEFERGRWMRSEPARAAVIVPLAQLTGDNREGARAVLSFIADEFGTDGIRRLLSTLRDTPSEAALEGAFGLNLDEFQNRFESYVKAH
jgi:hypothetical protein